MLFDTHIHFFDRGYRNWKNKSFDDALNEAYLNNISFFCNVGLDLKTSNEAFLLAKKYHNIYSACGFHPNMVNQWKETSLVSLQKLLQNDKVVAIGEIGLDYYRKFTTQLKQQQILKLQLSLAQKLKKPVLLHIRDAYEDAWKIVSQFDVKGILHCFSGTLSDAQKFIAKGFYVSFSGILTFKNAQKLHQICKEIPLQKIVLETDGPYLSPDPHRGKINYPKNLLYVAQKVSQLKNIPLQQVIKITSDNAFKILKIKI